MVALISSKEEHKNRLLLTVQYIVHDAFSLIEFQFGVEKVVCLYFNTNSMTPYVSRG